MKKKSLFFALVAAMLLLAPVSMPAVESTQEITLPDFLLSFMPPKGTGKKNIQKIWQGMNGKVYVLKLQKNEYAADPGHAGAPLSCELGYNPDGYVMLRMRDSVFMNTFRKAFKQAGIQTKKLPSPDWGKFTSTKLLMSKKGRENIVFSYIPIGITLSDGKKEETHLELSIELPE